jgi:hypothetical protein
MNETAAPALTPETLRQVFLTTAEGDSARFLGVSISVVLVAVVLWLVRTGRLREEYTPIWMGVAVTMVVVTVRIEWLYAFTRAIGAWTSSSVIFFLGEVFLVAICLNYAVRLSKAGTQMKNLAQEVAILRSRVEELEAEGG